MSILSFFRKSEPLLSIDVGSAGVKLVELDLSSSSRPKLVNIAMAPLTADVFSNNSISKTEKVSEQVNTLLEANSIASKRIVTAVPGPSVFTKKITVQQMSMNELDSYIQLEAGNFIPHNIDAVRLDYHVIGEAGGGQMDVLVVAVKNEIIDSFIESFYLCGLEAAVVDVDYFALQNIFELNYPELADKTVALINIGARYSAVNICRDGQSLFTGDIPAGGRQITETITGELGLSWDEAEKLKKKSDPDNPEFANVHEVIQGNIGQLATEISRQLSFFWSAAASEGGIDKIFLSGGSSLIKGLAAEVAAKTEVATELLDPFREIECGDSFDPEYLKEIAPFVAVGLGMAIRQPGDRIIPDF